MSPAMRHRWALFVRKNRFLRWMHQLYLLASYRTTYFLFTIALPVGLLGGGAVALSQHSPITDPLIDVRLFVAYLGVLAVLQVVVGVGSAQRWSAERGRIQQAVARHLGLSSDSPEQVRQRILALVPCTGKQLRGALAALGSGKALWMCFLPDRLLVVSGATGQAVEVPRADLRELYLVEALSRGRFQIAIGHREAEASTLSIRHLDDVIRIVNVLIKQGIVLKYSQRA